MEARLLEGGAVVLPVRAGNVCERQTIRSLRPRRQEVG